MQIIFDKPVQAYVFVRNINADWDCAPVNKWYLVDLIRISQSSTSSYYNHGLLKTRLHGWGGVNNLPQFNCPWVFASKLTKILYGIDEVENE